jgi:uncharacterized protein YdeI (YjbR/CyaY-like superfamily)
MIKTKENPELNSFFSNAKKWKYEMAKLRTIVLSCGLTEEKKWYQPVYTFENNNVAIVSGFKEYCVLSFFKGALLKDAKGILKKPGENSQSVRTIRFTSVAEIAAMESTLKKYIREAIEAERAGLKVKFKKITEHKIPQELETKFKMMPALKIAFRALTPGRQRAYLLFFSQPKQAKTREARIEKSVKQILSGKGLND